MSQRLIAGLIFLLGFALQVPSSSWAAPDAAGFEIKLFDIQQGRLVFSYAVSEKNFDIYVLDFTELTVKPLVTTLANDESPSWSPDGSKIVFHSDATGDTEIYVVNADGSNLQQLTNSPGADENPSWSPDGKSIVFQTKRRKTGADLYVMSADGTGQRAILQNGQRNVCPMWSPRKDEVVFSSDESWPGWELKLYNFATGRTETMTKAFGSFVRPSWHPDGSSIVFSYGSPEQLNIFRGDKGKQLATLMVQRPGRNFDPSWDEKGRYLFFAGEMEPGKQDYQLLAFDSAKIAQDMAGKVIQVLVSKGSVRHPHFTSLPSLETLQKVRPKGKKPSK